MSSLASTTRLRAATSVALLAVAAFACSSDKVSGPSDGTVVRLNVSDPQRDTLDNTDPTLYRALDLRQTQVRTKRDTIIFVMRFTRPVAPPTDNSAASVYGYIDMDTDQSSATGELPSSDFLGGDSNIGVDYYVDLVDGDQFSAPVGVIYPDGTIDLAGYADTEYRGDSVVVRLPTDVIGFDEGNLHFTLTLGTGDGPSDIAPNTGRYTIGGSGAASVASRLPVTTRGALRAGSSPAAQLRHGSWSKAR